MTWGPAAFPGPWAAQCSGTLVPVSGDLTDQPAGRLARRRSFLVSGALCRVQKCQLLCPLSFNLKRFKKLPVSPGRAGESALWRVWPVGNLLSRRIPGRVPAAACPVRDPLTGASRCAGHRRKRLARFRVGFLACAEGFLLLLPFSAFPPRCGFASFAPFLRVAGCDGDKGALMRRAGKTLR